MEEVQPCVSLLSCWYLSLALKPRQKSRTSAFLLLPPHSNQRRGMGNAEDGKQASNHDRAGYLVIVTERERRRVERKRWEKCGAETKRREKKTQQAKRR